jgi:methyl-accepting chemotaxis protein
VGGVYDLSSGSVQWLGEHPAQPKLLAYNSGGAHSDAGHAAVAKHGRTEAADAAPIELVPAARLSELDQARSAKPHVEVPHYPPNTHNSLNLLLLVVGVIAGAFGLVSWKTGLFQQLGIRGKLYSGFAAVVLLAVAIGGVGYTSLSQVSEKAAESLLAVNMEFYASEARALQNRFILEGIADHERGEEILAEHAHTLERVHVLLDEFESLPLDEVARGASGELAKETQHYEEVFTELVHYFHEIEQLKKLLTATGKELDQGLVELIHQHEAELAELEQNGANSQDLIVTTQLVETLLEAEVLAAKIAQAETEFLLTKHLATVAAIEQLFGTFYARIDRAIALEVAAAGGETGGAEVQHLRKLREKALGYQEATAKIVIDELLVGGEMVTCDAALGHFSQEAEAIATRAQAEAAAYKASAARTSIMMVVVAALVGSLLSFFISRGITKPVQIAISGLTAGSDHVRVAAGQVSTASQSLAETSTEQASSLEETSSALEELTAMTRQNAENSGKASHLAETARNNAASGDQTMHQLNGAMNAINESSGEISKIIKVIEEIAFQTNLLALNAAVEAARAGEHGKGFAVVADEVRSLALRAAEAARDTTGLIEQSVARAQEGTSVAASAGSVLQSIVGDVTQIADLLGGINTASNEQARGVDQINSAVSQIDQVTQTNAASAEESASAAEELSAQATQLNSIVDSLVTIVSGGKSRPSV